MTTVSKTGPLITVCMPIYNSAAYLAEAIESVLAQTFTDFELLITDDCSTDGTAEIAARYAARDPRVVLHVHPRNQGMVNNWNYCMHRARGRYIKFLFGDDFLAPETLARMAEILDQHPEVTLVASGRTFVDESSRPIKEMVHFDSGIVDGRDVIWRCIDKQENYVGEPSAVMFRKEEGIRGFDTDYRQLVDLEMWYHLMENGCMAYIKDPLCSFRKHAGQMTQKNEKDLTNLSEFFALSASYLRKPYIGYGRWGAHWFMFHRYYTFWKYFRRNENFRAIAAGIIARQFGELSFLGTLVVYKVYNPFAKVFRKVDRFMSGQLKHQRSYQS